MHITPMKTNTVLTLLLALLLATSVSLPGYAISFNQTDDFEDGTIANWSRVFAGGLTNIADNGPMGAGDNYLQIESTGGSGAGSRFVMINEDQWTGDYLAAGVNIINADVNNLGSTDLNLRIAVGNTGSAWYASTNPIVVPAGSGWQNVSFDLSQTSLVSGVEDLATTLSNVDVVRILSSENLPNVGFGGPMGDALVATLGIDNITAIPEPSTMLLTGIFACLVLAPCRRRT